MHVKYICVVILVVLIVDATYGSNYRKQRRSLLKSAAEDSIEKSRSLLRGAEGSIEKSMDNIKSVLNSTSKLTDDLVQVRGNGVARELANVTAPRALAFPQVEAIDSLPIINN